MVFCLLMALVFVMPISAISDNTGNSHGFQGKNVNPRIMLGNGKWMKTYGGDNMDMGYSVDVTSDGGYIVTGYADMDGWNQDTADMFLLKVNSGGTEEWMKTFQLTKADCGFVVEQTNDGGFFIIGSYDGETPIHGKLWLLKTDVNGAILKENKFFDIGGIEISGAQTDDGGCIVACGSSGLLRVDSNLDEMWRKDVSFDRISPYLRDVKQTNDGGYISCGECYPSAAYLIKTDVNGDIVWTTEFKKEEYPQCLLFRLEQTTDGGYIASGRLQNRENNVIVGWVVKTDSSGVLQWEHIIDENDETGGVGVAETNDNGYSISGWTLIDDPRSIQGFLLKLDQDGNREWIQFYTHIKDQISLFDVQQTGDGGFITVGREYYLSKADILLIKTDSNGESSKILNFRDFLAPGSILSIEAISGGFGVKATVANVGTADAENVEWSIVFDGPVFIGKEKVGTVTIPAGGEATIKSGFIFGIGRATITVTVGGATKTASGFVLGPLVLGVKEET